MSTRDCVFCKIAHGFGAAEDLSHHRTCVSFVPLNPVTPGHRLFVPVRHVADAAEDPILTGDVATSAAAWAAGVGGAFNLIVNAGAAASQTVPHLHWHYVPRRKDDGLLLPWSGQQTGGTP
jgi:histidine triad (HIT) family protein